MARSLTTSGGAAAGPRGGRAASSVCNRRRAVGDVAGQHPVVDGHSTVEGHGRRQLQLLAVRPVVAAVAEAHQLRRGVGAAERDRGEVVGQPGEIKGERAQGGHEQVLPDRLQGRGQGVQRPRQAVVVALCRLDAPQVGQRRPRQPRLDVDQGLRRQQAVEHQHPGDQPRVEVPWRAPVGVAVPVHHLPQPQAVEQRQQQRQGAQVQDQFPVQRGLRRRGVPETRRPLRRQPPGADRMGRVWHRSIPPPRASNRWANGASTANTRPAP
jgi:hypothetical protein